MSKNMIHPTGCKYKPGQLLTDETGSIVQIVAILEKESSKYADEYSKNSGKYIYEAKIIRYPRGAASSVGELEALFPLPTDIDDVDTIYLYFTEILKQL